MTYKISIITATFNSEKFVSGLISCLRQQSSINFEWIVADGGSTDRTLKLLGDVDDIDLVIDSRPDHGIYDAINRALGLATGDYYVVVGSDDVLYPDAIERMYDALDKYENTDVIVFGVKFGDELRTAYWRPASGWLGASHVVTAHSVGMLIRKSLHQVVGVYSLSFPLCAEALFIKRLLLLPQFRIATCASVVGEFNLDGASNSNTARGLCEGYLVQLSTEHSAMLQTLLFILRVSKNIWRICREAQWSSTKKTF